MPNLDLDGNFPDNQLEGTLRAGLQAISHNQLITFILYKRVVLPFDGYVFWVRDLLTDPLEVFGSFHYQTDQKQEMDYNKAYQNVVFTTPTQINNFNEVSPDSLWIGQHTNFEYAFSSHGNYYEQANLWHYRGQAVYPEMRTQILNDYQDLPQAAIVSNSLPIWISLNNYAPVYPSFLVPENLTPPYIVCHVDSGSTSQLQPIPLVQDGETWQLMKDKVKLVIYGFDNRTVQNYLQYIARASMEGAFGIMKVGFTVRDGKHIQSEVNVLAQQKFVELEISYNQSAVYDTIQQYILKVLPFPVTYNVP